MNASQPRPGRGTDSARAQSVAFSTLGCKLNLYETDALATRFREGGYRVVDFAEMADVYVVNSCTVTNRADRKSRNLFNRARRRSARPLVVMTGCFVDSHRDEIESEGSTLVVPNLQKNAIYELVQAHGRGEIIHPTGSVFDFPVPDRSIHTRTMIKVQDGCDNFCTFCIIPYVRGHAASRPAEQVRSAVGEAVRGGSREIVLTGVNMSRYRSGDTDFAGLIRSILDLDGEFRVRISSLEPDGLGGEFIDLFRHPKMCRHLHLCLQSASERLLLAMRRQYSYEGYRRIADCLRSIDPLFNLTTDMLVGFPGETDEDFRQSVAAIDEIGFGHVHTFPYSPREGTRAARLPQLPERIRSRRAAAIRNGAAVSKLRYRKGLVGVNQTVLVESREGSNAIGFGEYYVPIQIDAADGMAQNSFVPVVASAITDDPEPALVATAVDG